MTEAGVWILTGMWAAIAMPWMAWLTYLLHQGPEADPYSVMGMLWMGVAVGLATLFLLFGLMQWFTGTCPGGCVH